jgi:hypothetical protein
MALSSTTYISGFVKIGQLVQNLRLSDHKDKRHIHTDTNTETTVISQVHVYSSLREENKLKRDKSSN